MKNRKLNTGATIPEIGFGLWKINDQDRFDAAVTAALDAGYRHFDTAQAYGNENFLGKALERSQVSRDELFLTTKIWNDNFDPDKLATSFQQSLKNLRTDYVDLLLLHFPVSGVRQAAWTEMEKLYGRGTAKAIGVSNYTIPHLQQLLSHSQVIPAVNQVELHIYLQQPELLKFCAQHGIIVEAYSPLAHGHGLENPVLGDVAAKYEKTPAQIMVRWCIEVGTVPLPKSENPERVAANLEVDDFELDADDMSKLAHLNENLRTCWDPTDIV